MTRILIGQFLLWPMLALGAPAVGQIPAGERGDSASTPPDRLPSAGAWMLESPVSLERDIFTYVSTGRRDPFHPAPVPTPSESSRSVEAEVLGILSHIDPRLSVVVVRVVLAPTAGGGRPDAAGAGRVGGTYRLRLGERVGNTRILAIHEHHVVVEVDGPTGIERRLLEQSGPRRGAR